MNRLVKNVVMLCALFFAVSAHAVENWQIIPDQSSVTFTATQNDAPIVGKFTQFSGQIVFDPAHLDTSKVDIVINTDSLNSELSDVVTALKSSDWFDVKKYPQAKFSANQFVKMDDKHFQAKGQLTIRDKTQPVVLDFILKNYSDHQAQAEGNVVLKRTQFGLGQGEWASTKEIKDDVRVQFVLSVKK